MADWIGHLLGQLPGWLFWPALIIVIVIAAVVAWGYAFGEGLYWSRRNK